MTEQAQARALFIGGVLLARDLYERSEVTFGDLVVERTHWFKDHPITITRDEAVVAQFTGETQFEQAFAWVIDNATDDEIRHMVPRNDD